MTTILLLLKQSNKQHSNQFQIEIFGIYGQSSFGICWENPLSQLALQMQLADYFETQSGGLEIPLL